MWIWLEALDVLLFRDARPFNAGEDVVASGFYPPFGHTVLGALRSRIVVGARVDFKSLTGQAGIATPPEIERLRDRIGGADSLGTLEARGPFIAQEREGQVSAYFPLPADRLVQSKRDDQPLIPLAPTGKKWGLRSNPIRGTRTVHRTTPTVAFGDAIPDSASMLLSGQALAGDLAGEFLMADAYPSRIEDFWGTERRTGLERSASGTAEDGKLYFPEFTRPTDDGGLLMKVSGLDSTDLPATGVLALGAEGRAAAFTVLDSPPPSLEDLISPEKTAQALEGRHGFRLYLATPAVFRRGWMPDFVDDDLRARVGSVGLRLAAAFVSKPGALAGWDLAKGKPRPLYRTVPAGAVYHFEKDPPGAITLPEANEIAEELHFQPLAQLEPEFLGRAGLGVSLVGALEPESRA